MGGDEVLEAKVGDAKIVVDFGIVRIEIEGLLELLEGFFEAAL